MFERESGEGEEKREKGWDLRSSFFNLLRFTFTPPPSPKTKQKSLKVLPLPSDERCFRSKDNIPPSLAHFPLLPPPSISFPHINPPTNRPNPSQPHCNYYHHTSQPLLLLLLLPHHTLPTTPPANQKETWAPLPVLPKIHNLNPPSRQ